MLISIDPTSPTPLGDQVAASVRRAIIEEHLHAGDKLPPASEVAAALGINMHTVLRGYQQLRGDGLIDLRRGRAATLTAAAAPGRVTLTEHARELVALARGAGFDEDDIHTTIRCAYNPG